MSPDVGLITVAATSAVACATALVAILPLLRRLMVDVPNHRSSHAVPTPRGGGVAIVIALVAGSAGAMIVDIGHAWAVVTVVVAAGILGLADDLHSRPATARLVVQLCLGAVGAAAVIRPGTWPAAGGVLAGAFFIAAYTNAFNFMDGINGISSLNAAVTFAWYGALAYDRQMWVAAAVATALLAAVIAFLPFNALWRLVFLGDAGSYALGTASALLAVWLLSSGAGVAVVAAPLTIYVADTFVTFVRRAVSGHAWSEAHRDHTYQRLVDRAGMPHLVVAGLTAGLSIAACAAAATFGHLGFVSVIVIGLSVYFLLPTAVPTRDGNST